ncbi:MAG: phosphoribosylamine--glycine ligase [Balneolaceae bacterium]
MEKTNVLLIGGGGREHAMAWKISRSGQLGTLYIAPGNPGTAECGTNVSLNTSDFDAVLEFVRSHETGLVVVGPEQPLVDGLADFLMEEGIAVFGPTRAAAMLEGSKEFAKDFMRDYNIPTARYRTFEAGQFEDALAYTRSEGRYPVVLKADGLAAGKGVFICDSDQEVALRLDQFRDNSAWGEAAEKVVVEEFMEGEEASVFVISDGYTAKILHNAQDHKRIGEGDTGLNTGGMGAYSPAPVLTSDLLQQVENEIIQPTITGMQINNSPYKGILYLGLMITEEGPKVVEYNCRFGDPECQVILPSLKNDLLELMIESEHQRLDEIDIELDGRYRCCVVMASGGYPESYQKGKPISGLAEIDQDSLLFLAGARDAQGEIVTSGGRVLSVVGSGKTLQGAIDHAYKNVEKISFENAYYRRDIGAKGLKRIH